MSNTRDTLILSLTHIGRGGYALWWGPDQNGYYAELEAAGRYTRAEAESICAGLEGHSVPVPEAEAISKAFTLVDFTQVRKP